MDTNYIQFIRAMASKHGIRTLPNTESEAVSCEQTMKDELLTKVLLEANSTQAKKMQRSNAAEHDESIKSKFRKIGNDERFR